MQATRAEDRAPVHIIKFVPDCMPKQDFSILENVSVNVLISDASNKRGYISESDTDMSDVESYTSDNDGIQESLMIEEIKNKYSFLETFKKPKTNNTILIKNSKLPLKSEEYNKE